MEVVEIMVVIKTKAILTMDPLMGVVAAAGVVVAAMTETMEITTMWVGEVIEEAVITVEETVEVVMETVTAVVETLVAMTEVAPTMVETEAAEVTLETEAMAEAEVIDQATIEMGGIEKEAMGKHLFILFVWCQRNSNTKV